MADKIVTDFKFFIHQQIRAREEIGVFLSKLEAAIAMMQNLDGFHDISEYFLYNYIWVLADLVEYAAEANRKNTEELAEYRLADVASS